MSTSPGVAQQAAAVLAQCSGFIEILPDAVYIAPSSTIKGGSIGTHVRHTLDHFRALLDGHARGEAVLYDQRARGVPVETNRAEALDAAERLLEAIVALDAAALEAPVRVQIMLAADGTTAELGSTLGRELAFASHHAIHHCAMMNAIALEHGQQAQDGFGKAPSTLCHQALSSGHQGQTPALATPAHDLQAQPPGLSAHLSLTEYKTTNPQTSPAR